MKLSSLIFAVALSAMSASHVGALTLSSFASQFPCGTSQFTTSTQCAGAFAGNDANQDLDGLFGETDWEELAKVDVAGGTARTVAGLTISGAGQSGSWAYAPGFGGYQAVMGVLKAGNDFVAYLLEPGQASGSWNTAALRVGNIPKNGGNQPAISHVTLYGVEGVPSVPLPAGLWLLLAGAGALGAIGLRRRRTV